MKLNDYVSAKRGRIAALAARLERRFGRRVDPAYVSQMASGRRPVSPAFAVAIEQETERAVPRWEHCCDWHRIWPELIGTEGAPPVPPAGDPAPESPAAAPMAWPPLPSTTQEMRDAG